MSIVNYDQAGEANQPSPIIWKDCLKEHLNELGRGFYKHDDFMGGITPLVATTPEVPGHVSGWQASFDAATVLTAKAAERGGYLDIETDGDDNDGAAIFLEPFCVFDLNSGNKIWWEARFEVGAVADQAVFLGLTEKDGLSLDVIADDCAGLVGQSYVGARILNDDTDGLDAAYKLDAGTEVEMLATITQAVAIPSADRFDIAADTELKVGQVFDGGTTIRTYVNGIEVDAETIAASTFANGVDMGFIAAIKTGTAAAVSFAIDWIRVAYEDRR